ncbi:MAG: O-methyltransferase [Flavobacteriales bacterium]
MFSAELLDYLTKNVAPEPEILQDLRRQTHLKVIGANMISGHVQGRFLAMLTSLCRANSILEIGTFTGYSALCFAEGLALDGHIDSIDINEETLEFAQEFIIKAGYEHQITLHHADAIECIPNLNKRYDLVFIDADKELYYNYLDLIYPLLNPKALVLVDNVLWHGKLFSKEKPDAKTQALLDFNINIQKDQRFQSFMLPLRDGLYLLQKI